MLNLDVKCCIQRYELKHGGWGGVDEANRDNYYITDESEPAKLGSSLGWLLQLDGDNEKRVLERALGEGSYSNPSRYGGSRY